ncbi:hypothetical protein QUB47_02890, partial [Microcoleus sp. AT9_B5]
QLLADIVGEPAPTIMRKMCIAIVCWVGRVYLNHQLLADIVGEPAPTIMQIQLCKKCALQLFVGWGGFI